MPIFEILCEQCGKSGEVLVFSKDAILLCPSCGSDQTTKLMSATSSLTGKEGQHFPGSGDTACCGSTPDRAGCAGPGSCCGKASY